MLEFLYLIGIDPAALVEVFLLSLVIFTLLFKRFIVSVFDPMTLFLVGLSADTSLMICLPWDLHYKWEFIFFMLAFWLGLLVSARRPLTSQPNIEFDEREVGDLAVVLMVLFGIIAIANLILGASVGFPLFSANPSIAKATIYRGGIGLIRRVDMGPFLFFCSGTVFLAITNRKRRLALILLGLITPFLMVSGSKGALLPLVYTQALLVVHPAIGVDSKLLRKVRNYTFYTLILGVGVAILVPTRDSGSLALGITAFFERILMTGDGILFYFADRDRIANATVQSLSGYFQYLTNDTLSMLRLADYQEPLGSVILGTGNNGFGPNAQWFLCADLFFGPVWGCVLGLVLGYVAGIVRTAYFRASACSPAVFVFKVCLAVTSLNLFFESSLFLNEAVTTVIVVFPIWAIVRLLRARHSILSTAVIPPRQDFLDQVEAL